MSRALAEKAQALPGFQWMPGMRSLHPVMGPARVVRVSSGGDYYVFKEAREWEGFRLRLKHEGTIDPTDPATGGCLLHLLGDEAEHVRFAFGRWTFRWGRAAYSTGSLGEACCRFALDLGCWPRSA